NRDPPGLINVYRSHPANQFHFHIGASQRERVVFGFQQYVRQNRHGLFLFHNASDALQRNKQGFTADCQFHGTRLQLSEVNVNGLSHHLGHQVVSNLMKFWSSSRIPGSVSWSSLTFLQACNTVVWSRPPNASPISGRL